jgi:hypothetical protein
MKFDRIDTLVVNTLMTVQPDLGANKIGTDSMKTDDPVTSPCRKLKNNFTHKKPFFFMKKELTRFLLAVSK